MENKELENNRVVNEAVLSDVSESKGRENNLSKQTTNPRLRDPVAHIKERKFLQSKNLFLMRNFENSLLFRFASKQKIKLTFLLYLRA